MRVCPACGDPVAATLYCPRCAKGSYSRPYSDEPAPEGLDPYRADPSWPGSSEPGRYQPDDYQPEQYQPDWYQAGPEEPESFAPGPYPPDPGEWQESDPWLGLPPGLRRRRVRGRRLPRRLRVSGPWPDSRTRVSIPWPLQGRRTQAASAALTALALLAGAAIVWTTLSTHQRATAAPRTQLAGRGTAPSGRITVSPSPSAGNTVVTMVPGLSQNPDAAAVDRLLASYITAINDHDFQQFDQLLIPQLRARLTAQSFVLGYGSTTDSAARLVGISAIGNNIAATMIFISRQQASASATVTSCTFWDITLFLQEQEGRLLIGAPPPGYRAYHLPCT